MNQTSLSNPPRRFSARVLRAVPRTAILVALLAACFAIAPARAYIEAAFSLGKVIADSTNIVVMRVEKVDREKNTIIYSKVSDLKGKHNGDTIKHNIGRGGFHPREWQNIMAWAEVGQTAILFHNGGAGEVCIKDYWYQCYAGDWWSMSHAEPYLLRSFCGKPEKLIPAVNAILAGQEVLVPCMADGDKMTIQLRTGRIQRMKASLKIQDYNPARDFAGWGVEEFRAIAGMPGFLQYSALARTSPDAGGVAPMDFDGDGKMDFCLYGASKVVLLQNAGGSLNEVPLGIAGGARGAAWADYNGDGKPDLLLATPSGPRLFTNAGGGAFKDSTSALPRVPTGNITAAGWIDFDGDGKPDIVLADGFNGLRAYRNLDAAGAVPVDLQLGKWRIVGPFENTGGQGFAAIYPPEQLIDFKGEYPGKNGEKAAWKEFDMPEATLTSVKVFREDNHAFMTIYLAREISVRRPIDLPISLGSGGPLTVWINGRKVLAENVARQPAADQTRVTLKLNAGKNVLLIKACYVEAGRSLYFASTAPDSAETPMFEDVSDKVGLGHNGIAGKLKGDRLAFADVDGDGRIDFLYSAGNGVLVLNKKAGFVESKDSGLAFRAGQITPVFGDFDGDKAPDLFVPQSGGSKLFRNDGQGHFSDVTAKSGDLARLAGEVTSAEWADFNNRGKLDLIVGCLRGPNRYFRNNGDGTFTDGSEDVGFFQRIFNTRGLAVTDLNKDGVLDVVFNNEGQESAVLIGDPQRITAPEAQPK
jgi:hypothetical protein